MKLFTLALIAPIFIGGVLAWTKEDYEIFDIVSGLEAAEGKGTTFYSWLDVAPTASSADIGRAYRRKSLELHPDKNPGVKGIHDRFARLSVVSQILRNTESRERYDFFYKNGVPKWRGTGYYYSRYRPGLVSVSIFLVLLSSALQYLVQGMTYRKEVRQVRRLIAQARTIAWGPKQTPLEGPRKVRVPTGEGEGSRSVEVLVHGDDVFLLGSDESETVALDESVPVKPAVSRTWPVSLARAAIAPITSRLSSVPTAKITEDMEESDASTSKVNGNGVRKLPGSAASVAGGRRRKAVKPVKRKPKEEKEKAQEE
ncbi:DnaJ-domain-containing protein [Calocera viscosa TUFC12733]|uniref:DnaJ-domain-containing protein n=1 Tax=Calocera viscosa (strain TUFC12733) TaxID=1330018 RepID=A0A167KME9_CALVF|nr:DnaJ-domain-containing protein [Calocera viscosa TUFC12733]